MEKILPEPTPLKAGTVALYIIHLCHYIFSFKFRKILKIIVIVLGVNGPLKMTKFSILFIY